MLKPTALVYAFPLSSPPVVDMLTWGCSTDDVMSCKLFSISFQLTENIKMHICRCHQNFWYIEAWDRTENNINTVCSSNGYICFHRFYIKKQIASIKWAFCKNYSMYSWLPYCGVVTQREHPYRTTVWTAFLEQLTQCSI